MSRRTPNLGLGGLPIGYDRIKISGGQASPTTAPEPAATTAVASDRVIERDEISLAWVAAVLGRRYLVIVTTVACLLAVTYFYVSALTPTYTANALVVLEARRPEILRLDAVASTLTTSPSGIQTEVDVLRSAALAERVIERQALIKDPEFNPFIVVEEQGLADRIFGYLHPIRLLRTVLDWILPASEVEEGGGDIWSTAETQETATIDNFLWNLAISNFNESYSISVAFTSEDPEKAALIANTVVEQYLVSQLEAKYDAMRRANTWLAERVTDLRTKVEESEFALQRYKEGASLIQARGLTVSNQQLSELNSQLVMARTALAEAEAKLRRMRQLIKTNEVESAAEVLASPTIQVLKEQELELVRREADLMSRYGDRHPTLINLRAETRDLRTKLGSEINKIILSLTNEVEVARTRTATLQNNLGELQKKVGELAVAEVKLGELQREADANKALFEDFLSRFKETSNQQDVQQPDARIVSRARPPLMPSHPRINLILAATGLGALVLGIMIALLLEHLDKRIRTTEQLEAATGLPALGMVPAISRSARGQKPHEYLLARPGSAYSEALHSVLAALQFSIDRGAPRTVMVGSALPADGKTTFALSFAIAAAKAGFLVALVDADLRRPNIAPLLKLDQEPGLLEYLNGTSMLADSMRSHSEFGIKVMPAGNCDADTPDAISAQKRLLTSSRMRDLVEQLSHSYDLVIIDSPPLMAVADANFIAGLVDATLFVVRWSSSTRQTTQISLQQLRRSGATIAGTVLTRVNLRKHRGYGYRDQGYYYQEVKKYYR